MKILKKTMLLLASLFIVGVVTSQAAPPAQEPSKAPEMTTYNAIEFEKFSDWGDKRFVNATIDKNRKALQIAQRLEWGAAETTYRGESGKRNVTLNAMLEGDGESTYRVYINGKKIGEVTNPRIHGTNTRDYTIKEYKLTKKPISIKRGDKIRVEFCSATNGLVPEGKVTATSRGRWRSVVIE